MTEGIAMHNQIVIGWDGTDQSRDAVALASDLRAPSGRAIAVCVVPFAPRGSDWGDYVRSDAQREAKEALAGLGLEWLEVRAISGMSAAQGLDGVADNIEADLIVVGSSHHGPIGQVFAGSVAGRLLHGAPCAVAVAPKGYRERSTPASVVGVAYDGSIESKDALDEAARLAQSRGASVKIVTAVPPLDVWSSDSLYRPHHTPEEIVEYRRAEFARILDDAAAPLPAEARPAAVLVEGRAADAIVDEARKGMDLLVMGSRAYGPLRRAIGGSTAAEVMRRAPCPVVVIPRGSAASPGLQAGGAAVGS